MVRTKPAWPLSTTLHKLGTIVKVLPCTTCSACHSFMLLVDLGPRRQSLDLRQGFAAMNLYSLQPSMKHCYNLYGRPHRRYHTLPDKYWQSISSLVVSVNFSYCLCEADVWFLAVVVVVSWALLTAWKEPTSFHVQFPFGWERWLLP